LCFYGRPYILNQSWHRLCCFYNLFLWTSTHSGDLGSHTGSFTCATSPFSRQTILFPCLRHLIEYGGYNWLFETSRTRRVELSMVCEGRAKSGGREPQDQYCATLVNISSELSHCVCLSSSTLSASAVIPYAILSSGRETSQRSPRQVEHRLVTTSGARTSSARLIYSLFLSSFSVPCSMLDLGRARI
jgi:hypothetical protein